MTDYIIVTNWEPVSLDDFYLSDKWLKNNCPGNMTPEQVRQLVKDGQLFEAFIVSAVNYCVYKQMDAEQVFIDDDDNSVVLYCENAVISNKHEDCWEYDH